MIDATADSSLVVSEIFGPTFQGEGPSLGRLAFFLRLGTCNLHCTWCDTKYTWDWSQYDQKKELVRRSATWLIEELERMRVNNAFNVNRPLLVITGGEPLIQRDKLFSLVTKLCSSGWSIEVETNGTLPPIPTFANHPILRYNVSPKLAHSGNTEGERINVEALREFARGNSIFKFVVRDLNDLLEIQRLLHFIVTPIDSSRIWIMPEGQSPGILTSRIQALADAVLIHGWNMTTRLHVQLWGAERGR